MSTQSTFQTVLLKLTYGVTGPVKVASKDERSVNRRAYDRRIGTPERSPGRCTMVLRYAEDIHFMGNPLLFTSANSRIRVFAIEPWTKGLRSREPSHSPG
jgi:hypothetical protein